MSLLSVEELSVTFTARGRKDATAVDGVSFAVDQGQVVGLVGESGCGKSVTSLALMGLLPRKGVRIGGRAEFDGQNLLTMNERKLRDMRGSQLAMIFQDPLSSLNPVVPIGIQVTEILQRHRGLKGEKARKEAASLLDRVGIPDPARRLKEYPHQLSGGMRQRVMIAMALALEPEIVIMDEPTTALDVVMQRQILRRLVQLREQLNFSVVFITHDISLLIEFSDRIAIMYGGRIVEQAGAAEIYRDPRHPYSDGLLHSFPALHGPRRELTGIPGSPPHLSAMPTGCAFHPRCGKAFAPCAGQIPLLAPPADGPGRAVACHLHA